MAMVGFNKGDVIGKNWIVGEFIGSGSYGRVLECRKKGTTAVVKVNFDSDVAAFELRVIKKVSGKVGVMKLLEEGRKSGAPFFIVYKEGISLIELRRRHKGKVTLPMLLTILHEGIKGLKSLHYQYILHRDLSLANILVCDRPGAKICLIDYGLAGMYHANGSIEEVGNYDVKNYAYASAPVKRNGNYEFIDDCFALLLVALETTAYTPFDERGDISIKKLEMIGKNDPGVPMPSTAVRNFLHVLKVDNRSPTGRVPRFAPHQKLLDVIEESSSYSPSTLLI